MSIDLNFWFQNPDLSWNYIANNSDITPDKDEDGDFSSHGTRCAGEIAMQPDNGFCGVGVAYGANIGGTYNLFMWDVLYKIICHILSPKLYRYSFVYK